jgi:hypothetical protein
MDGYSQSAGLFASFTVFPYSVRELLSCWALFAGIFFAAVLIMFVSVLAWQAGEYLIYWMRSASRFPERKVDSLPVQVPRASL